MKTLATIFAFLIFAICGSLPQAAMAEDYEVLPALPVARGQILLSDGPALVNAENHATENRFQLGIDYQFGRDLRLQLGWTIFDFFSSGESSAEVGQVSRGGSGPNIGYFIIPEKLYLMYTFSMESVAGSRVTQDVSAHGHQLTLGYRIFSTEDIQIGAQLSYLSVSSVTVPIFDQPSNSYQTATYPGAQIWNLSLAVGAYFF
jgi:hypothetical protein